MKVNVNEFIRRMTRRLLAGNVPLAAQMDFNEGLDLDIRRDDDSFSANTETPNFSHEHKVGMPNFPKIEFKPGNSVRGNYLGWADYVNGRIEIPAFDSIMKEVNKEMKPLYAQARAALHRYILNHEIFELEYMPQNELQHGRIEARNMGMLEYTDPEAYFAGLALHKKRLKDGNRDEKAFSKVTSRHYDLGKAFKKYGAELDKMVGLVGDVISGKPTYSYQTGEVPSNVYGIGDYGPSEMRKAA